MKIIKHGNMNPRAFTCGGCGCKFVAEVNEYRVISACGSVLYYEARCPECGAATCISEPWEEENE